MRFSLSIDEILALMFINLNSIKGLRVATNIQVKQFIHNLENRAKEENCDMYLNNMLLDKSNIYFSSITLSEGGSILFYLKQGVSARTLERAYGTSYMANFLNWLYDPVLIENLDTSIIDIINREEQTKKF